MGPHGTTGTTDVDERHEADEEGPDRPDGEARLSDEQRACPVPVFSAEP